MLVCVDWASVDGNGPPDFETFKRVCTERGSRAVIAIIRGAWGIQRDLTVVRDWKRAMDAGLICSSYLYLRMPIRGFSATPEQQVAAFAESVQSLGTLGSKRDMAPCLDVEDSGLPAVQELELVRRAWAEMQRAFGVPPVIYTSARVWAEDLHNLPAADLTTSPLWLAKPWPWKTRSPAVFSGVDGVEFDPTTPPPWGPHNWWMHQYQGDAYPVPGFTKTVDLSRFRMMRVGEIGQRVAWVRQRLGLPAGNGALFSIDMVKPVREFQMRKGITVDGVIGPQTFAALTWTRIAATSHPPTAA